MIYENCKIYGPYLNKADNRLRIVAVFKNGTKTTISYPKYLMEQHLGRYLTNQETVDHIDCNPLNNEISNLRILSRVEHASIDAKRLKTQNFKCPICNNDFSLSGRKLHDSLLNRRNGKAGPFCSRICAGKYGKNVQNGQDKLVVVSTVPLYTSLKLDESLQLETSEVNIAKTVNA